MLSVEAFNFSPIQGLGEAAITGGKFGEGGIKSNKASFSFCSSDHTMHMHINKIIYTYTDTCRHVKFHTCKRKGFVKTLSAVACRNCS